MKDEYEELCARIRSQGILPKTKPMNCATPPPVPSEKRITQADIDKITKEKS